METLKSEPWLGKQLEMAFILVIGAALFLFNEPARTMLSYASVNQYFNLFYIPAACFAGLTYFMLRRIEPLVFVTSMGFLCIALLTNLANGVNAYNQAVTLINIVLPLFMTGIVFETKVARTVFTAFTKLLNIVVILMVVIGIPDMISGGKLQVLMINHLFEPDLARLASLDHSSGVYRFYFIFGHTLTIAWYFFVFFLMNVAHNRYISTLLPNWAISLITFAGLIICNSRTAMVLGIPMILLMNRPKRHGMAYILSGLILLGVVLSIPAVQENISKRYVDALQSGSFSGGRNEAVLMVYQRVVSSPGLFIGGGPGYSRKITQELGGFIESFEYPIMMLAYDFSIMGTAAIYLIILVYPVYRLIADRQWNLLMVFLFSSAFLNGFNILSNYTDYLGQLCFVIMLLKNLLRTKGGGGRFPGMELLGRLWQRHKEMRRAL